MTQDLYQELQRRWERDLPDVPFPFDDTAHPQDVVTAMSAHLAVRHRRPVLHVVTSSEPWDIPAKPKPTSAPEKEPA